jgi:hypothetical protein
MLLPICFVEKKKKRGKGGRGLLEHGWEGAEVQLGNNMVVG